VAVITLHRYINQ